MVEMQAVTAPARAHGNGSDAAVARTVRRRRGLPDRRAVIGALLVTTAAVGLFSAAGRAGTHRLHPYVVARRDLPPGAVFTAGDLVRRPMDLPPSVAAHAFDDPSVLVGATLVAPLAADELVQASSVAAHPGGPGHPELSVPLDAHRLPSGTKEGERLDLVATYGTGNDAYTAVVVRQALVVRVERGRGSLGDTGPTVLTVALDDPSDVLALSHASQLAKLTAVRAATAEAAAPALPYRPPAAGEPASGSSP